MENQKEKSLLNLAAAIFCFIWIFMLVVPSLFAEEPHVILYNLTNYRGKQIKITQSAASLSSSPYYFDNMAASIKLVGVSSIAVYENGNYGGRCETITRDIPNLGDLDIRKNKISSIKLNARCASTGPSAILYERMNYQGNQIRVTKNEPVIAGLKASSLKLDGASSVVLYTGERYSGFCHTFTENLKNLSTTRFNNNIKSVKINGNCGTAGPAVVLYENTNYSGDPFIVTEDFPDLRQRGFNNKASSLKLLQVNSVSVFDQPGYRGACQTFKTNTANLGFASNKTSSIKINKTCDKYRTVTIKNLSAAVIRYSVNGVYTKGSNIVVGKEKVLHLDPESRAKLTVEIAIPMPIATSNSEKGEKSCEKYDVVLFSCWTFACEYDLVIDKDYKITVSGTVFKWQCSLE